MSGMVFSDALDLWVVIPALALYLSYAVYLLFFKKNRSAIYSFILWSISWAGILLLLLKPYQSVQIRKSSAIIAENQKDLPDHLKSVKSFTSINDFLTSDSYHTTDTLYVQNQIISIEDLDNLQHVKVFYIPVDQVGIQEIDHSKAIEGSPIEIKGSVYSERISSIEFLFSGNLLSTVSPDEDETFLTSVMINSPGDYMLDVKAITDGDSILEQLALKVYPKSNLSFLLLNEYPTFESKYLKDYLSEEVHRVAARSQVSQNKFVTSFSNMRRLSLNTLSPSNLSAFNTFIISMAYWNKLGSASRENILDAVYTAGKALVLAPSLNSTKAKNIPYHEISDFEPVEFYDGPTRIPLSISTIKTNQDWKSIKFQNIEVAVASDYGTGTISIAGISESYPLLLSGSERIYHSIWSTIFSDLVAIDDTDMKVILSDMIWEGTAEHFFYFNSPDHQAKLKLNQSSSIPLVYVPFTPNVAYGTMYPPQGWNQMGLEDRTNTETFYVYDQHAWPLIRRKKAQTAAMKHNLVTVKDGSVLTSTQKEITYIWGMLLFILGMGGLWLKERIGS